PMCETSEKGEKLFSRVDILPMALGIGQRILEVFGYQEICNIVFRLKSNRTEIDAVINGDKLPTTELLLGIHKMTGVSIDWLLADSSCSVTCGLVSTSRRSSMSSQIELTRSGLFSKMGWSASFCILRTSVSSSAMTVAERGSPVSRLISPKKSFSRSLPIVF